MFADYYIRFFPLAYRQPLPHSFSCSGKRAYIHGYHHYIFLFYFVSSLRTGVLFSLSPCGTKKNETILCHLGFLPLKSQIARFPSLVYQKPSPRPFHSLSHRSISIPRLYIAYLSGFAADLWAYVVATSFNIS